jgi:hypothetical protein
VGDVVDTVEVLGLLALPQPPTATASTPAMPRAAPMPRCLPKKAFNFEFSPRVRFLMETAPRSEAAGSHG